MKVPAWQGDWEKRIYDPVHGRDFATYRRPCLTAGILSRGPGE
jgi:hypothetical protein